MERILLVEDDEQIVAGLSDFLRSEGFVVDTASGQKQALAKMEKSAYDLMLLDISLSDGNGYAICAAAKASGDTAVIFLTASADEFSTVAGLDMGADDYITKPFRIRELISRIKTVLRRYHQYERRESVLELGDLTIFPEQGKVFQNGREVVLTVPEYRLLLALVNNKGQILTRSQLLEAIWDVDGEFVNDNTLSVCIKRLREKIEANPGEPTHILTVRGLGYKAIS